MNSFRIKYLSIKIERYDLDHQTTLALLNAVEDPYCTPSELLKFERELNEG